jgi:hypothetical protein
MMDSGRNRANTGLSRPPARHRRRTVDSKRNASGQEFKISRPAKSEVTSNLGAFSSDQSYAIGNFTEIQQVSGGYAARKP